MTKMLELVAEMRARLTETARTEETLIAALGAALHDADTRLLAEVRDLTMAHEARRVAILTELQTLAGRIGAFPALSQTDDVPGIAAARHPPMAVADDVADAELEVGLSPGDWRRAVSNIKDDLDAAFGRPRTTN
jgi:hypothetical protein